MNPTALKLGADAVANNPTLQIGPAGASLLVFVALAIIVMLIYFSKYERGV